MTSLQIVHDHTNLIYKIASKFYGIDQDDLFQAGVLGLLKAHKNFKNDKNTKFSTYAYDYIYGEMYLLASSKTIKMNKDILKLYRMIEKTRFALAQKYDRVPSDAEIASFLELSENVVSEAVLSGRDIMSLDNTEDMPFYETIKINEKVALDDKILISEGIEMLSNDEQQIIKSRYFEDMTQSEVARKLDMTQVMVSRYEKRGLSKMQEFMRL